jgi:hypothetical protein
MDNKKNILINKFDVAYREIENIDYQYALMSAILNRFNENQLKSLIKSAKMTRKLELQENNLK